MRIAIFSDIHDNRAGLQAVLADAERHNADRLIFLGDLGNDAQLFESLQGMGIDCLFGNWEVSGLLRLPSRMRDWVGTWPSTLREGSAVYCHATPDMPAEADNTQNAARYMKRGIRWQQLFPRLHRDEAAVWNALAVLEEANLRVTFHGHTHVQMAWAWSADSERLRPFGRRLQSWLDLETLELAPGAGNAPNRYIIGVGSAGQPNDGPALKYVMYEPERQTVWVRHI